MQSDQQNFPQKLVLPFYDQVGCGYTHNAPVGSFFGAAVLSPGAKYLTPLHGVHFQSSEIITDQTDKRSQIMFHPAIGPKFCCPSLNAGAHYFEEIVKKNDGNNGREISSSFKEDSDDIDALLSLEEEEEEEEECDEEEISTARTYGNCASDLLDSCSSYGSKVKKSRLASTLQKSTSSGSSHSEKKKRQKMKKMVKVLRGIVPGGNQLNTVAVLDEAVSYLKSLKVEVQKLGVGNFKI